MLGRQPGRGRGPPHRAGSAPTQASLMAGQKRQGGAPLRAAAIASSVRASCARRMRSSGSCSVSARHAALSGTAAQRSIASCSAAWDASGNARPCLRRLWVVPRPGRCPGTWRSTFVWEGERGDQAPTRPNQSCVWMATLMPPRTRAPLLSKPQNHAAAVMCPPVSSSWPTAR